MGAHLNSFRSFQEAYEIQQRLLLLSQAETVSTTAILDQTKIIEVALANTLNNMGFLYCRQNKYVDSIRMLQEASKWKRRHLGTHHPALESCDENLRYVRFLVAEHELNNGADSDDESERGFFNTLIGCHVETINNGPVLKGCSPKLLM
jgi:hypothetical protein